MLPLVRACPAALAAVVLIGCQGGRGPYPVEGTVVWADGSPAVELADGVVVFGSVDHQLGAQGMIGPDARFRLTTFTSQDGAVTGTHKVIIGPPPDPHPDNPSPPVMDPRFRKLETSGLEVVVKPEKNVVTLTVERTRPRR